MIQFCFARASERSFSLSRVFRGEKNFRIVLERPWQQQNPKAETNSGLVHENLLVCPELPLLQMDFWFLCQSTTSAKPLNVWVFWVSPFLPPFAYMWQTNLWTMGAPKWAFYSSSQTKEILLGRKKRRTNIIDCWHSQDKVGCRILCEGSLRAQVSCNTCLQVLQTPQMEENETSWVSRLQKAFREGLLWI